VFHLGTFSLGATTTQNASSEASIEFSFVAAPH
jgi:hypothetical protein